MAQYVMSDLHGRQDVYHRMLERIGFTPEDQLYILGDVIDRGPDGIAILQEIMYQPNVTLLLGNHELMMLEALDPEATQEQIARWAYNHNEDTLKAYLSLTDQEKKDILVYLRTRADFMEVTAGDRQFYLVHGFPGQNTHDRVWGRPDSEKTENPLPDRRLIIGHTPVPLVVCRTDGETDQYFHHLELLESTVEILFARGFIDIDCGCGHSAFGCCLSCLRLEDMQAFYVAAPKEIRA